MSKKEKQIQFLAQKGFTNEQIAIVIKMLTESRKKLCDDIIDALHKKKVKLDHE